MAVATFNEAEVEKLREGGNLIVNGKYMGRYKKSKDPYTLPNPGENEKIKDFISYCIFLIFVKQNKS